MRHTVLIVDDDPQFLAAVARLVRRTFPDCYAITAESASRAIAVLSSVLVDLVVCDYNLGDPRAHGGDILAWVLDHQPLLAERFVFLTATQGIERLHPRVMDKAMPIAAQRQYLTQVMGAA